MCENCGCEDNGNAKIYEPGKNSMTNELHSHENGISHHHNHHGEHHHHKINVEQDILSKNNLLAERNRGYFEALNILALNMVSSPGSGKTSVIERTISELGNQYDIFVIEGDQQTANDAERIQKTGVKVIQINTGNGCHLDANMVNNAREKLNPKTGSIVIIENVGNLVCPSMFDLGEKLRIVLFSVTEGEDKPAKYPTIFHSSDVCVINKTDLLPYVDFNLEKAKNDALKLNPKMLFFEVSAKTGEGFQEWCNWLKSQAQKPDGNSTH